MILTAEQRDAIYRAASNEVHFELDKLAHAASSEFLERAIAYATIKHTINAMHQPQGVQGKKGVRA